MIERLQDSYGFPIDLRRSLPYEVDITKIKNEVEMDSWIRHNSKLAYKFLIFNYGVASYRSVVRFESAKEAVEYKLRIEY